MWINSDTSEETRNPCESPQGRPCKLPPWRQLSPSEGHYLAVIRMHNVRAAKMKGPERNMCLLFCRACPSAQPSSVHHCIHHRLNKLPGSWLSPRAPHCWHGVEYITTYWLSEWRGRERHWRIGRLTLLLISQLSKQRTPLQSPPGSCGVNLSFSTAARTSKPTLPPVRGFWKWTPISRDQEGS